MKLQLPRIGFDLPSVPELPHIPELPQLPVPCLKIFRFWRTFLAVILPICLLPIPLLIEGPEALVGWLLGVMACYWSMELIPLPVTALLPIVFLPMFGIVSTGKLCTVYMKGTGMLLIGGLIIAIAVEHSNLHSRIALNIISLVGTTPRMLMLGFMIPTAFLSMWISNTATTSMMIPILESVLQVLEGDQNMRNMMMLSVAYSANIGGTGTLIGTGPNLVLYAKLNACNGHPLSFMMWMAYCIPVLIINLIIAWLWLQLLYAPLPCKKGGQVDNTKTVAVKNLLQQKKKDLGRMTAHEAMVLFLFCVIVLLWFFREPGFMEGWGRVGDDDGFIGDATPAILVSIILLAIPQFNGESFLPWEVVEKKLPWGIILLIGGGFALGEGMSKSGLNVWIGDQLALLKGWDSTLLLLLITALVTFATEIVSNTACANMVLPVLLELSKKLEGTGGNPLYLMLPATLACSFAFMLPVSTPPNAIVYKASGMKISDMLKAGFGMNVLLIFVTVGLINSLGGGVFDLTTEVEWVQACRNATLELEQGLFNSTAVQ